MQPPFELTPMILDCVAAIERVLGRYEGIPQVRATPYLWRSLLVRLVQCSFRDWVNLNVRLSNRSPSEKTRPM